MNVLSNFEEIYIYIYPVVKDNKIIKKKMAYVHMCFKLENTK